MAKYTKIFEDGKIISILNFRGKDLTLTMIPCNLGLRSLEKGLDTQFLNEFPDMEEVLEDRDIDFDCMSLDEEIQDALEMLEEYK